MVIEGVQCTLGKPGVVAKFNHVPCLRPSVQYVCEIVEQGQVLFQRGWELPEYRLQFVAERNEVLLCFANGLGGVFETVDMCHHTVAFDGEAEVLRCVFVPAREALGRHASIERGVDFDPGEPCGTVLKPIPL